MKATLSTVTSILYDLLRDEKPHIVVVLGSTVDANELSFMAGRSGFIGIYKLDGEGYKPGMFVILRPIFVTVTKLPSHIYHYNEPPLLLYHISLKKHLTQPEVIDGVEECTLNTD